MRERRPGNEAKIRPPLYKGQNYMATIEGYYCSPKSVLYSEITLYYCVSHLITSVVKKICDNTQFSCLTMENSDLCEKNTRSACYTE